MEAERQHKLVAITKTFRPSGPVESGDLFAGRTHQIIQVGTAISSVGRHAVIYGERGVGKTSLAAVSEELFGLALPIRVNCDGGDNFASIWWKVASEALMLSGLPSWRHGEHGKEVVQAASEVLKKEEVGPDDVRHFLRVLTELGSVVIFFDEYDQVYDGAAHDLMANAIKALADHLIHATIVLIGVADDVDTLIAGHASIERNLEEVPMPRMGLEEIEQIVRTGYEHIGIEIENATLDRMVRLPLGLPHFAHLLAQKAAENCVLDNRAKIHNDDLRAAIRASVRSSDASLTQAYVDATTSSHQTLYSSVLLACALAPVDDLGYFAPGDLREPLYKITGTRLDIPRFARHLKLFCEERGPILERKGGERRWRYRFINPRMRPYVIMRALDEGVRDDLLDIAPAYANEPQLPF